MKGELWTQIIIRKPLKVQGMNSVFLSRGNDSQENAICGTIALRDTASWGLADLCWASSTRKG